MARYPALELHAIDPDLALAVIDEYAPAAVEEHEDGIRVFFARAEDRDHAATAVIGAYPAAQVVASEVDDEDWARRSQADLKPITVGRITVVSGVDVQGSRASSLDPITIVIRPSMGFGTGHHATTRLCLGALQAVDVRGATVLDVGTGSGILALAAARLGASSAVGIDHDPDAIAAARENLALNPDARNVTFEVADVRDASPAPADIVTANLTGALLVSAAPRLIAAVKAGGVLIVSGVMAEEEATVRESFAAGTVVWRGAELEWVGLAINLPAASAV